MKWRSRSCHLPTECRGGLKCGRLWAMQTVSKNSTSWHRAASPRQRKCRFSRNVILGLLDRRYPNPRRPFSNRSRVPSSNQPSPVFQSVPRPVFQLVPSSGPALTLRLWAWTCSQKFRAQFFGPAHNRLYCVSGHLVTMDPPNLYIMQIHHSQRFHGWTTNHIANKVGL